MVKTSQKVYIVKRPAGNCEIIPSDEVTGDDNPEIMEKWGPFESQGEAIARRVGLIRAGKCQPV
ncbi:MAG: DDE transposase family protein [Nostochopsis sp.]